MNREDKIVEAIAEQLQIMREISQEYTAKQIDTVTYVKQLKIINDNIDLLESWLEFGGGVQYAVH